MSIPIFIRGIDRLRTRLSTIETEWAARHPPTVRDLYPWLSEAGVGKVARATLDALTAFYEVTRDSPASVQAAAVMSREFAGRLRSDPSAEWAELSDFEILKPEAEPIVAGVLDRIGFRGPRHFPTEAQRYIARRDCEDAGGRMLRPWPPWIDREPRIKIPDPK